MRILFAFLIATAASVIGGICGIGGGIIIKPLLDMSGIATVSEASFLSGITVLAMSAYNTARNLSDGNRNIDIPVMLPLSVGAAFGGVAGKILFDMLKEMSGKSGTVTAVQSAVLILTVVLVVIYEIKKNGIRKKHLTSIPAVFLAGLGLGIISSFLGIGGGPVNLVVLSYFFSMDTKTAAKNSIFIILFSQFANLIYSIFTKSIPQCGALLPILMIAGGISGGIVGRKISSKLKSEDVDKLFIILLFVIIMICIYNIYKYI